MHMLGLLKNARPKKLPELCRTGQNIVEQDGPQVHCLACRNIVPSVLHLNF